MGIELDLNNEVVYTYLVLGVCIYIYTYGYIRIL